MEEKYPPLTDLPKLSTPWQPQDNATSASTVDWVKQLWVVWRLDFQGLSSPEGTSEAPGQLSQLGDHKQALELTSTESRQE